MTSDDDLLEIFDKSSDQMRPALRAVYEAGIAAVEGGGLRVANALLRGAVEKQREHIARLVKREEAVIAEAVAAERERCARIAETRPLFREGAVLTRPVDVAAAIRADDREEDR